MPIGLLRCVFQFNTLSHTALPIIVSGQAPFREPSRMCTNELGYQAGAQKSRRVQTHALIVTKLIRQ